MQKRLQIQWKKESGGEGETLSRMLLRWMSGPKYPTDGEAKAKMIIYARSSAMQFAHAEQARRFYEVAGTKRDHELPNMTRVETEI